MEANLNKVRNYYPKGSYMVGISRCTPDDFSGTVYFPASSKTIVFSSVWNLLKQIEADIIQNEFPQNTFELRRWFKKETAAHTHKKASAELPKQELPYCSFLIQIQYCQNATWQGSIHWMEGHQQKSFRSQFEMLKLMEEAAMQ